MSDRTATRIGGAAVAVGGPARETALTTAVARGRPGRAGRPAGTVAGRAVADHDEAVLAEPA